MKKTLVTAVLLIAAFAASTGAGNAAAAQEAAVVLRPARVFDGQTLHQDWAVVVRAGRIVEAGPAADISTPPGAEELALPGQTLMPGLIEGHSHVLLHPYNETPWTEQVLQESLAERTARAVNHVRDTLMAGVTTIRDLGTEGAGYADVGIKAAITKGVIPGPRMIITTRALVATGSYNPKGAPEFTVPKGAEVADGYDDLVRVTRDQIGRGADWIKVYADYRWGPDGSAMPTFTEEELRTIVEVAASSGRYVPGGRPCHHPVRRLAAGCRSGAGAHPPQAGELRLGLGGRRADVLRRRRRRLSAWRQRARARAHGRIRHGCRRRAARRHLRQRRLLRHQARGGVDPAGIARRSDLRRR